MSERGAACESRWVAPREALMDPTTGVVKTLEHDVKWDTQLDVSPAITIADHGR